VLEVAVSPFDFGILVLLAVPLRVLGLRIEASFLSLVLGGGVAGVMGTMVGIHGAVGLFGRPELSLAAMLLPGVVAGLRVTPFIAERIDRRRLRYGILLISAGRGRCCCCADRLASRHRASRWVDGRRRLPLDYRSAIDERRT
jgi:hypothetical protein